MDRSPRFCVALMLLVGLIAIPSSSEGAGAVLQKSGSIQITSDGAFVWVVLQDHDAVSIIETATEEVTYVELPAEGGPHLPRSLAILPNDTEVWVTCHDSGTVFVLDATDGSHLETIELHPGSGPMSVVIAPDGNSAWVTLLRSAQVAVFDTATYELEDLISGLFDHPFGLAFTEDGTSIWVSHTTTDGEDSYASELDPDARKVRSRVIHKSVNPKSVDQISADADPIPEGGYILPRGHLAPAPGADEMWVPVQYLNRSNPDLTQDSSVQAAIEKIDTTTSLRSLSGRIVLTAVYAHNDTPSYLGEGWNAGISGTVDLAFSDDGLTAYFVNSYSNDVIIFPTDIEKEKQPTDDVLPEITVGDHPIGIVASPTEETAYVLNHLSRDVSVIDLDTEEVSTTIDAAPGIDEPWDAEFLTGAKIFHSSADARTSGNGKVSCASCHIEGEGEALFWDFSELGAGVVRKTMNLRGLEHSFGPAADGRGQLHRSGDRDEVQDFDHTFGGVVMGGTGFLDDPNPSLGDPNGGLDEDLDALADYVLSLPAVQVSPAREHDGTLPEAAVRGGLIFQGTAGSSAGAGCNDCHTAPDFSDLDFHDVGGQTLSPEFEGPDFNTPSLVGAWSLKSYAQASGFGDSRTLGGVVRKSDGTHGDASGLTTSQKQDLVAFLNCIDGTMANDGIAGLADTDPPRVISVQPISLSEVIVIFNETVDPITAEDADMYEFSNGTETFSSTNATRDDGAGDRVRVGVALEYNGCEVTYTLIPGAIEDIAASYGAAANNALDVDNQENQLDFSIDGAITVTFGNATGLETFGNVAQNAGFYDTPSFFRNWSRNHWVLIPGANENKGFVQFDFVDILSDDCGVTDSSEILDASFTAQPDFGHINTLELRRCFKPWNEPFKDFCNTCAGALTYNHASRTSVSWNLSGAKAIAGDGEDVSEYWPDGDEDLAGTTDCTVDMVAMNERVEFSGQRVTEAFGFWFDNPEVNFGYCVEISGTSSSFVDFYPNGAEGNTLGNVLSITFQVEPNVAPCVATEFIRGDVTEDGAAELVDALGVLSYLFGNGDVNCLDAADVNGSGFFDISDPIWLLAYIYLGGEDPAAPFPTCGVDETSSLGCTSHAECP